MSNAIQQTKREMYEALADVKGRIKINYSVKNMLEGIDQFEERLEVHLEILRIELEYEQKRSNNAIEERDAANLRMHAIDHAYNESQKTVGRQIDVIASLQDRLAINAREKRAAGTCGQVCGDRVASERSDGNAMALLGVIVECQQLVSDWAVYGYRAKKQMKKMDYVLNNNPELRAALDHFEGGDKA